MERPGDQSKVHVSAGQLDAIEASLAGHLDKICRHGFASVTASDYTEQQQRELHEIQDEFLAGLMEQLASTVVVDDSCNEYRDGDGGSGNSTHTDKTEPYDFALNDKLRDSYTQFEQLVAQAAALRRRVPAQCLRETHTLLRATSQQLRAELDERVRATAALLLLLGESAPESAQDSANAPSLSPQTVLAAREETRDAADQLDQLAAVARF